MNIPALHQPDPRKFAAIARVAREGASTRLPGGVSSDIQLIEVGGERYCVKQALAQLKVEADWRAPVARNHSEADWLRTARGIVPDAAPEVLYEDAAAGWFVMPYLPPERYPLWKAQLRDGSIDTQFAAAVGDRMGRIHAATAGRDDIRARFDTDGIFYPLRPEPYLIATGLRHPDLAGRLRALSDDLMRTKKALVHGDISPKNILAGPHGPVFLDAECAWYGDPAFDLAFVLNHLLLKCIWRPQWSERYLECFDALCKAYVTRIGWEPAGECERRATHLLPGLLLGRIDGKSPVEYITEEADRDLVRRVARLLLAAPPASLRSVADTWRAALRNQG
jgi:aminoglycoside phosphotransferase (APT) family kinase protein